MASKGGKRKKGRVKKKVRVSFHRKLAFASFRLRMNDFVGYPSQKAMITRRATQKYSELLLRSVLTTPSIFTMPWPPS